MSLLNCYLIYFLKYYIYRISCYFSCYYEGLGRGSWGGGGCCFAGESGFRYRNYWRK